MCVLRGKVGLRWLSRVCSLKVVVWCGVCVVVVGLGVGEMVGGWVGVVCGWWAGPWLR